MPNWCDNNIEIEFKTAKQAKSFLEFIKSENENGEVNEFDFNQIVPCPEELYSSPKAYYTLVPKQMALEKYQDKMKKKYGVATAYDFHCEYWGTKWNSCDPFVSQEGKHVAIGFLTAWSPPAPIALAISKKYPDVTVTLRYIEPGVCFAGIFECENGECTCDVNVGDIHDPTFVEMAEFFGMEDIYEDEEEDENPCKKDTCSLQTILQDFLANEKKKFKEQIKKKRENPLALENMKADPEAERIWNEEYMP